ncbi:MAG: prepilin-type N-terminal cleavage/methylation domain-containing protein [Methanotrichaceae archaeon]|nr:prepilin-type N-terminal cleavage/methylation domain-containing protein [Methanotrichaceae archaeon]
MTLIELLIAMAISAVLSAAIYRTFIGQHKTYAVQEQVVDMQQNVRVAINRMMREIRMAGFGNVSNLLPLTAFTTFNGLQVLTLNNIITPSDNKNNVVQSDDQITIIGAFEQISTLAAVPTVGTNTIQLSGRASEFDNGYRKYICIGGLETHTATNVDIPSNTITLNENVVNNFPVGTSVFKVKAITYRLRWDNSSPNMPVLTREDNTDGGGTQVVAENIEDLQFRYILDDKSESDSPADASKIRLVRVTVNARTRIPDLEFKADPEFKAGTGGFRRRTITSNILVRNNMGLNP